MNSLGIQSILIVGAGHCGGRTAQHLREMGFVGRIDLVGNEPSIPYERPPLSKEVLAGQKQLDELNLMTQAVFDALRIVQHSASVISVDTALMTANLSNGCTLSYSAMLFANGGTPRSLTIEGAHLPQVMSLRTKSDAEQLQKTLIAGRHIVIVGGGFIGLEVAASAIGLGCSVTLIEGASQLMGRAVPKQVADRAMAVHKSNGVQFWLGVSPTLFTTVGQQVRVDLSNGGSLLADTVVVGIGIQPNIALAREAGIHVRSGIVVDSYLRTNVANILAAGDVAEFPNPHSSVMTRQETWHNAESQARVAAQNLMGANVEFTAPSWFWSDQYEFQLQVSGEPSSGASTILRERNDELLIFYIDQDERLVGVCGWGRRSQVTKALKIARAMVDRGVPVDRDQLEDLRINLKSFLK